MTEQCVRLCSVALEVFLDGRLKLFADKRNDPNIHASSDLSPYLNFGQIAAARCALVTCID